MTLAVVDLLERIHVREDQAEGLAELGARRKRGVEGAGVEEAREEIALLGDAEAIAELAIAVRVPADERADRRKSDEADRRARGEHVGGREMRVDHDPER